MCGITGWVSFDRELRSEAATLDAMTETMACRGPDDRGTWVQGPAALGHRRLAIIDLPGGRQPMTVDTADGTVALVYSGRPTTSPSSAANSPTGDTGSPPTPTPRSSCAATSNGATASPNASTACTPSRSGTAAATGSS